MKKIKKIEISIEQAKKIVKFYEEHLESMPSIDFIDDHIYEEALRVLVAAKQLVV